MIAIVVLGMHRSGTSCLAGMLAAAGLASAGEAVRNWDNARGHYEALAGVRLNEAVLAHSGGHWLSPPAQVRWTAGQAQERDRLLSTPVAGLPPLLKDPRTLLCLPFWRASPVPFHAIGIVRHPLAVARSLESWRGMPLAEGIALWLAHNRALAEDRQRHGYPLIDFEQSKEVVVAAVQAAATAITSAVDTVALAEAYEERLVHHDDGDAPEVAGLAEAVAWFARLRGERAGAVRRRSSPFPRVALAGCAQHLAGDRVDAAESAARAALGAVADVAAVLVPVVSLFVRHRRHAVAARLIAEYAPLLDAGLADLLGGKVLLASGDAAAAAVRLAAACAVPQPFFQARHLLPQALRQAGRHGEARTALATVVTQALYPHGPLATLAEWSWLDGERAAALTHMGAAIAAAPLHRRGRLRTRHAEWLIAGGDVAGARRELRQALAEDPGYRRAAEVLVTLG